MKDGIKRLFQTILKFLTIEFFWITLWSSVTVVTSISIWGKIVIAPNLLITFHFSEAEAILDKMTCWINFPTFIWALCVQYFSLVDFKFIEDISHIYLFSPASTNKSCIISFYFVLFHMTSYKSMTLRNHQMKLTWTIVRERRTIKQSAKEE